MPAGRPSENRVELNIHVTQETADLIRGEVDKSDRKKDTLGKIVDRIAKHLKRRKKPTP